MTNNHKSLFIDNSKTSNNNNNNNNQQTNSQNKTNDKNDYQIELKAQNTNPTNYNPSDFNTSPKSARFFVIKSYSEDDVHRSIKYNIWCSTEHGNRRLDSAFSKANPQSNIDNSSPVYLFFSVNGSGHFCGMAEMRSRVDYNKKTDVWSQDKWRGCFQVKWIYVKDVPNSILRNIKLENNENKPVTNSRDTQEIPFEKGKQVLKIFHTYNHSSSIFDDFEHYEKRQDETNGGINANQIESTAKPADSDKLAELDAKEQTNNQTNSLTANTLSSNSSSPSSSSSSAPPSSSSSLADDESKQS